MFQIVLWSTCILLLRTSSGADLHGAKGRFRNFRDEVLIKELNLVDGPEPTSVFWQKFGNPSDKEKSSNNPLKDVIKSLYRYEAIRQSSRRSNVNDTNKQADTLITPASSAITKDVHGVAPPVLEDVSEIVFQSPSRVEVDKSQRFTHSIRYGYGAPY